jgi:protein involved in polysaccharide export with SLBB domain
MNPLRLLDTILIRLGLITAICALPLAAQTPTGDSRLATRVQLQATAQTLERSAASPAYGERLRARARADLERVRRRLAVGDFTPGERIIVRVEADSLLFADTITVLDSLVLNIPGVRRVTLDGVLRSELEQRLSASVGAVVRNARIVARPLMRVAVFGDVTNPGFHAVPAETLLDQLLSLSGSPSSTAAMRDLRVERADTVLYAGPEVLAAIARGRTLEALDLRDGDALIVPPGSAPWDRSSFLQIAGILVAPLIAVLVVR